MTDNDIKELRKIVETSIDYGGKDDAKGFAASMTLRMNVEKYLTATFDQIDRLQKQNDCMREALSFYCSEEAIVMLDGGSAYWTDKGIQDHGKRARQALKDCEGM